MVMVAVSRIAARLRIQEIVILLSKIFLQAKERKSMIYGSY